MHSNHYSEEITEEIRRALIHDPQFQFRREGDFLRKGICPNCGKKTCYVKLTEPFRVSCDRLNNCGWSASTRDLYRDIFDSLSKRVPATKQNPNATADAYMRDIRGFDLEKIHGMYQQGFEVVNGKAYPAVEILVPPTTTWRRIIDAEGVKANGGSKAMSHGPYKSNGWTPPGMTFEEGDTVWITEGIFKSMAFLHIEKKAISGLSASNLPRNIIKANTGKNIHWIIALDADTAGELHSRKFYDEIKAMNESCFVAFPKKNDGDWDDLYRAGKLTESYLQQSIRRGFLYLSWLPGDYAFFLWSGKRSNHYLVFEFRGAIYQGKVSHSEQLPDYPENDRYDLDDDQISTAKAAFKECLELDKICECMPRAVYTQYEKETGRRSAVFHIGFSDSKRPPRLMEIEGHCMRSADAFNTELLKASVYYAFTGNNLDLEILRERWAESGQREVAVVPFAGYDHETGIYIYPEFAYRNGVYQEINDYGYFDYNGVCLKTTSKGPDMIDPDHLAVFPEHFFGDFIRVFGNNGMVLLAWWTGTYFAEQLRKRQASWCFMEFTGERGAGKSTLLRLLWKMTGFTKEQEGLDPNKGSEKGFFRLMAQYSNLPVVILEADGVLGDKGAKKGFNFNQLKEFYNFGAPTRTIAAFTNGLELRQDIFRGGLLISQNEEITGTEDGALLSRFVSCRCTKEHFTPESRELAEKFEGMGAQELGGFLHMILSRESELLSAYFLNYNATIAEFRKRNSDGAIRDDRILKCHAQVAAWVRTLSLLFGKEPEFAETAKQTIELLWQRSEAKQRRLSSEHPYLETFWSNVDYIQYHEKTKQAGEAECLNHSCKPDQVAILYSEYVNLARSYFLEVQDEKTMRELFPRSRERKFLGKTPIWSRRESRSVRCYVFQREATDK